MSNISEARKLLRDHRYGALSTQSKKLPGFPFGSITPYLLDHDGSLIIFISALAEHTKNIQHDPRVSLITHNQSDPAIQMQGRVTVIGNARQINAQPELVERYLRHFPEAADLLTLDFAFYQIQPVAIRYIGGVGRIHWPSVDKYLYAADFAEHESALLHDLNSIQRDCLGQILQREDFEIIGLDCDGLDIRCGEQSFRLNLSETLSDPERYRQLKNLAFASAN